MKSKRNIYIRVDVNSQTGLGHLSRCLALAEMLEEDHTIHFVTSATTLSFKHLFEKNDHRVVQLPHSDSLAEEATAFSKLLIPEDIVVLDGYSFDTAYQQKIKEKKCALVCIDDLQSIHFVADVILNQSEDLEPERYSKESYTKVFHGFDVLLLRRAFLERSTFQQKNIEEVLLSMGGADAQGLSLKLTEAALNTGLFKKIHVLTGTMNPNLPQLKRFAANNEAVSVHAGIQAEEVAALLVHSGVALCSASISALEACAVGTGLGLFLTAKNQERTLSSLVQAGAGVDLGDITDTPVEELSFRIKNFATNTPLLTEVMKNQEKILDGRTGERIKKIFSAL